MTGANRSERFNSARFTLDALVDKGYIGPFDGWTTGELWNGWAVPYFEYEEAIEVLAALSGAGQRGEYHSSRDVFLAESPDGETEEYAAETIETASGRKKVYGLGARNWIWSYAEPDN